ncbi:MAG: putative RNA polymerase sigma factor FecI [Paracidovorax wautersii]|uniref:Putative RNA polymerase sigma factor FecI n=1 Tax=Paracidovorax wautersii TaxID=1177982 RepID=A0A7V8FQN6_9BURK|nr:MAG: putative RNA polymerase sigma factor FecI [Paracidovorax wautersii]
MALDHYQDLLRFCHRITRDADLARDAVQETYTRFLTLQARARANALAHEPLALLRRIARNLLVDQHRRGAIRQHADIDALPEADQLAAPAHLQPEESTAARQVAQAYLAAIESLPPRCREAFVLHIFEDLPQAEVARRMGISSSMVEKHIVRGMVACRACQRQLAQA